MCRLIGYLGPPAMVDSLLFQPPHALFVQSYAPRHQDVGHINADGWGVGWYDLAIRPEPARYRTVTPLWADRRFAEIAPLIRSDLVVAAARNATPGLPVEETSASPFLADRYLFTHNGFVVGFRDGLSVQLRRSLSERREAAILGASDSEVVFALILDRLDKGASMVDATVEVLHELEELTTGRFNFLLTDGDTIVATRAGNSLFTRLTPMTVVTGSATTDHPGRAAAGTIPTSAEAVWPVTALVPHGDTAMAQALVVASEPFDDGPGWTPVPERSVVTVSRTADLVIEPL